MTSAAIALRAAAIDDADLLLAWVNDPETLAAKQLTSEPIPREAHVAWLAKRLGAPTCRIWIIERAAAPIGQLRFEDKGGGFEIDVFVAPSERGSGAARRALALGLERLRAETGAPTATALVLKSNMRSARFFEACGFERIGEEAGAVRYSCSRNPIGPCA